MEEQTRKLDLTDKEKGIISRTIAPPLGLPYRCLSCAAAVMITEHTAWKYSRWRWLGNFDNIFGWYVTCPNCGQDNFMPEALAEKFERQQVAERITAPARTLVARVRALLVWLHWRE